MSALQDLSSAEFVPILRIVLFGLGLLAAAAWNRARPALAVSTLGVGGLIGLLYWLLQISPPFGLGSDRALAAIWAQTGVNAALGSADRGFVWGTAPAWSVPSTLTALGVPVEAVFHLPLFEPVLLLALFMTFPFLVFRSRMTAALASGLVVGGGLWPGSPVFEAPLRLPGFAIWMLGCGGMLLALVRIRRLTNAFSRRSGSITLALIVAGALLSAGPPGGGWAAAGAAAFALASMALTPWLRVASRRALSSPGRARQAEAFVLLAAFSGSGLFWWEPTTTLRGFAESKDAGGAILQPLAWIRANTGREEVILTSNAYGAIVAARTGRRVLLLTAPGESEVAATPEPARRARFYRSVMEGRPVARLSEHYATTHLLLGPGEAGPIAAPEPGVPGEETLDLTKVYEDAFDFRVFRFTKK